MINEDLVEQAALAILQDQGILYLSADVISPDGTAPERASYGEVMLMGLSLIHISEPTRPY